VISGGKRVGIRSFPTTTGACCAALGHSLWRRPRSIDWVTFEEGMSPSFATHSTRAAGKRDHHPPPPPPPHTPPPPPPLVFSSAPPPPPLCRRRARCGVGVFFLQSRASRFEAPHCFPDVAGRQKSWFANHKVLRSTIWLSSASPVGTHRMCAGGFRMLAKRVQHRAPAASPRFTRTNSVRCPDQRIAGQ